VIWENANIGLKIRIRALKINFSRFGTILACFVFKIVSLWNERMSKINEIFDVIAAGIKVEGLRQKTIANNVANLQTPDYRRVDVKFQDVLAQALGSDDKNINDFDPEIFQPGETSVKSNGNDVNLEMEVGQMVKNSLRYKTYIKILEKKYQQIDMAIDVR
jgi:flagellar basal-body rod protein FlgB